MLANPGPEMTRSCLLWLVQRHLMSHPILSETVRYLVYLYHHEATQHCEESIPPFDKLDKAVSNLAALTGSGNLPLVTKASYCLDRKWD